ncbi:hypothetical protein ACFY5F_29630 [Streptomyces sp. NPDC013161]|uniref:hypothetical protein n=1 Tax=Streptomyces sp. NPDC013161 TaxID=3364862 RepID=UPI0036CCB1BE
MTRQAWALGILAGQTQAMLGPDLPDRPPVGRAAQEGFVRTALVLALHVRARSWAEADLGAAGQEDVSHPGERQAADAFDVLGRLMLPTSSAEGWTAALVTDLARGDETLEAAVKLGKYIAHPTFLALLDDTTRVIGEALHNINVQRLEKLADVLRDYAGATGGDNRDFDLGPESVFDDEVTAAALKEAGIEVEEDPLMGEGVQDASALRARRLRRHGRFRY